MIRRMLRYFIDVLAICIAVFGAAVATNGNIAWMCAAGTLVLAYGLWCFFDGAI